MDKLTKEELEEMWQIYFTDALCGNWENTNDSEMCFAIDAHYKERFGTMALLDFIARRL